jgi:hypothetical protein
MATLLITTAAQAAAPPGLFRAYLAPTGNDFNPCTLPLPCRLLPAALAAVADGGEIWILDSANYNSATVNITKSVSILAVPGAVGSVVATGGPAVSISADNLKVALRSIVIVPLPASGATHGISMTGASSLTIEDSLVANMPQFGVYVSGSGIAKITNTTLRNNKNYAVAATGGANVSVSGTKILGNDVGISADSMTATTTTVSVSDSIISGPGTFGVVTYTNPVGAVARISVTRCTIEGFSVALESSTAGFGSALITVNGSTITHNAWPWALTNTGAVIKSLGNNQIQDNTNAGVGTLTPASLQ